MPEDVKTRNYAMLSKYVNKFTAPRWGVEFVKEIRSICEDYKKSTYVISNEEICTRIKNAPEKKVRSSSSNTCFPVFFSDFQSVTDHFPGLRLRLSFP